MSSAQKNERIMFVKKPKGVPTSDCFKLEEIETPKLTEEGKILVQLTNISVDPYLRNRLEMMKEGSDMISAVTGNIIDSKNSEWPTGTEVVFYGKWQRIQVIDPGSSDKQSLAGLTLDLRKARKEVPTSASLGVLGMPGCTAYFGLKEAAAFKKGDIVFVTGAAGAVGSLVGQLAKIWGAKLVVGAAGGPEKCKLVTEKFGFDHCIDYKKFNTKELASKELKRISPDGYDVYFENTGGHMSLAFYENVRKHGRVALCGQISHYNDDPSKPELIENFLMRCIYTSVRIQGFVVSDYAAHWHQFYDEVPKLVADGKIKYEETIVEGFAETPKAFAGLFHGSNTGKMVVRI